MDGFVEFKLPANLRRIITMLPGIAVILAGVNPCRRWC
jgi:manganese transport protein